jgi:hypothetical protein
MKSPGTQFLEWLLTMASVTMTGAVLLVVALLAFSVNAGHLIDGHAPMIQSWWRSAACSWFRRRNDCSDTHAAGAGDAPLSQGHIDGHDRVVRHRAARCAGDGSRQDGGCDGQGFRLLHRHRPAQSQGRSRCNWRLQRCALTPQNLWRADRQHARARTTPRRRPAARRPDCRRRNRGMDS